MIGAHQVIGRGLARGIRRVRLVLVFFGKGRVLWPEAAVHLVGRNMQEAECALRPRFQSLPVTARGSQQCVRADDIGLDEGLRPENRAIDMRFGGEVHHRKRFVLGEQLGDQGLIADVAVHEYMVTVGLQAVEVLGVPGISQEIEVNDARQSEPARGEHEVSADEASTAGDKPGLHGAFPVGPEKMDGQAAQDAYSSGFCRPWAESPPFPGYWASAGSTGASWSEKLAKPHTLTIASALRLKKGPGR